MWKLFFLLHQKTSSADIRKLMYIVVEMLFLHTECWYVKCTFDRTLNHNIVQLPSELYVFAKSNDHEFTEKALSVFSGFTKFFLRKTLIRTIILKTKDKPKPLKHLIQIIRVRRVKSVYAFINIINVDDGLLPDWYEITRSVLFSKTTLGLHGYTSSNNTTAR